MAGDTIVPDRCRFRFFLGYDRVAWRAGAGPACGAVGLLAGCLRLT
jgi:hypothetical protein